MKYDEGYMKTAADSLSNYLYIATELMSINGLDENEFNESVDLVKKLIKHLKNGKGDKVFDKARYIEAEENGIISCDRFDIEDDD